MLSKWQQNLHNINSCQFYMLPKEEARKVNKQVGGDATYRDEMFRRNKHWEEEKRGNMEGLELKSSLSLYLQDCIWGPRDQKVTLPGDSVSRMPRNFSSLPHSPLSSTRCPHGPCSGSCNFQGCHVLLIIEARQGINLPWGHAICQTRFDFLQWLPNCSQ